MGSVEADDERQIAVADDWQLQRLARSSSTNTAAPCPGDIGGPSEQAYTRPAPGRPVSAARTMSLSLPFQIYSTSNNGVSMKIGRGSFNVIINSGIR